MKSLPIPVVLLLLISSCSHKISRVGYDAPTTTASDCEVSVTHGDPSTINSKAQLLGSIKLGDTGFSTNCNEDEALSILKKEACSLNANTILITEFTEPGFASTCYRCSANFYKTPKNQTAAESIPANTKIQYAKNYKQPKDPNPAAAIAGYAVGFVIGFLLVSLLF